MLTTSMIDDGCRLLAFCNAVIAPKYKHLPYHIIVSICFSNVMTTH